MKNSSCSKKIEKNKSLLLAKTNLVRRRFVCFKKMNLLTKKIFLLATRKFNSFQPENKKKFLLLQEYNFPSIFIYISLR